MYNLVTIYIYVEHVSCRHSVHGALGGGWTSKEVRKVPTSVTSHIPIIYAYYWIYIYMITVDYQ